jgi:hypothetical protein
MEGLPPGTSENLIQNLATWQSLKECKKLPKIGHFLLKNEITHNLCIPIPIKAP